MTSLQFIQKSETLNKTIEFLEKWQNQTKKTSLTDTFLDLIVQEKKTTAKTILEKIKQKPESSQWYKGYINALEGMILVTDVKEDKNLLINQTKTERNENLKKMFHKQSRNELQSNFDRGFFSAWMDYTRILQNTIKINKNTTIKELKEM